MADNKKGYTVAQAYIQIMPSTEKFGSSLKGEMESEGEKAGGHFSEGFKTGMKALAAATAAAATAIGKVVYDSVKEFSEYEQLVGGINKLFGEMDYQSVLENASNAFRTAGMSANEYMETVTSFSASLIDSLGKDTEAAVSYADMAITDMSDNANVFGTDIESIQNAYQGFAKQNYTMLDNLKLGYGGTKTEMERLIADANRVKEANGEMADLSIDSFADVVEAIHIMQEEMNISGTTASEASTTIQGSISSMKAAWSNLLVGLSDDSQDFGKLVGNLVETIVGVENEAGERVGGVINNIMPRVMQALEGIGELMKTLLPELIGYIPEILSAVLPGLLESAGALVSAFLGTLPSIIDVVAKELPGLLSSLGNSIITGLEDLTTQLPTLADSLSGVLSSVLTYVAENADTLIMAFADFLSTLLTEGIGILAENGAQIAEALMAVVKAVIQAAVEHPELVAAIVGMKVLKSLGGSIMSTIGSGITAAKDKISGAVKSAIEGSSTAAGVGAGLGIAAAAAGIGVAIAEWIKSDAEAKRANDELSQAIIGVLEANDMLQTSIANAEGAYYATRDATYGNAAAAEALYGKLENVIAGYDGSLAQKDLIIGMVDELNELIPGLSLTWDENTNSLNKNSEEIAYNIEQMKAQAMTAAAQELYVESVKNSTTALRNFQDAQSNMNSVLDKAGISMDELNGYLADGYISTVEMIDIGYKSGTAVGDLYPLWQDLNDAVDGLNGTYDAYIQTQEDVAFAEEELQAAVLQSQEAMENYAANTSATTEQVSTAVDNLVSEWTNTFGTEMPAGLQTAIQASTNAGIEIPSELVTGLYNGEIAEQSAIDRMNALVSFETAVNAAGIGGTTVSQGFVDNWLAGKYDWTTANNYLNSLVNFTTAINEASASGQELTSEFVNNMIAETGLQGVVDAADLIGETAVPNVPEDQVVNSGEAVNVIMSETIDDTSYMVEESAGAVADGVVDAVNSRSGDVYASGTNVTGQLDSGFASGSGSISTTVDNIWNIYYNALGVSLKAQAWNWGYNAISAFKRGMDTVTSIPTAVNGIVTTIESTLNQLKWKLYSSGYLAMSQFTSGMTTYATYLYSHVSSIASYVESYFNLQGSLYGSGYYAGIGFNNGLVSTAGTIYATARAIASNVAGIIRAALKISSPSRVMEEIGEYTGEGLSIGIDNSSMQVLTSAENMANSVVDAVGNGQIIQTIESSGKDYSQAISDLNDQQDDDMDLYDSLNQIVNLLEQLSRMQWVTDTGVLVGEMAPAMNQAFNAIRLREGRG